MNISYYKKWVNEFNFKNHLFKSISLFEDMYIISFKDTSDALFLYLGNKESLIFTHPQGDYNQPTKSINLTNLSNSQLNGCQVIQNDKILEFHFSKMNIYNQREDYYLIFEMITRYQNLILTKIENDKRIIIDCLKKITFADQNTRQVLPGCEYSPPKTDYIQNECDISTEYNCMNDYFSHLYFDIELLSKKNNLRNSIIRSYQKELNKKCLKLNKQKEELHSAELIDYWKQCVELLKPAINQIKTGMLHITLKNFYINDFPDIIIPLNPVFTPQKNLDYYVKKYRKALNGQKVITENIKKTNDEIKNIEKLIEKLKTIDDYHDLKLYLSSKSSHNLNNKGNEKKLFRVIPISDEWEIQIGRSNKENDLLTCKIAKPEDWWFHTRIFHGTHVVLRNYKKKQPPENLIILCARLAAYYSSAKNSTNVPVDYTKIRYVTKPRGSATGYVIYKNQKTLYTNPISIRDALVDVTN